MMARVLLFGVGILLVICAGDVAAQSLYSVDLCDDNFLTLAACTSTLSFDGGGTDFYSRPQGNDSADSDTEIVSGKPLNYMTCVNTACTHLRLSFASGPVPPAGYAFVIETPSEAHRIETFVYESGQNRKWEATGITAAAAAFMKSLNDNNRTPFVWSIGQGEYNAPPTGTPVISGSEFVGGLLTVSTAGIMDPNGLMNVTYTYQWLRDGVAIPSATGQTYTLVNADLNATLSVTVNFNDDSGNPESLTSASTGAIMSAAPTPTPISRSAFGGGAPNPESTGRWDPNRAGRMHLGGGLLAWVAASLIAGVGGALILRHPMMAGAGFLLPLIIAAWVTDDVAQRIVLIALIGVAGGSTWLYARLSPG